KLSSAEFLESAWRIIRPIGIEQISSPFKKGIETRIQNVLNEDCLIFRIGCNPCFKLFKNLGEFALAGATGRNIGDLNVRTKIEWNFGFPDIQRHTINMNPFALFNSIKR